MGLGVVGAGVADALTKKSHLLSSQTGAFLNLKRVLVRDSEKKRSLILRPNLLTTEPQEVLDDPSIHIVIEVMGGEHPALEYIKTALSHGKHLVTANKEVMAKHGSALFALAQKHQVDIGLEASVGGGIPIIALTRKDLLANRIYAIHAIINGTTNFILTQMADADWDFQQALSRAKEMGFAEPDPSDDVEGRDAAYKLAILATLAFRHPIRVEDVYYEGITRLRARDFRYARELGYTIKLLAIGKAENNTLQVRVHPAFVPQDLLIAKVDGVFNAIQLDGDLVGRLLLYGKGAGSQPTTSAVLADVINIAQGIVEGRRSPHGIIVEAGKKVAPIEMLETRYYLRLNVADRPGVLAQIARVLGDLHISISSVIQKEADPHAQTAEIVIMTHPAREASMQQALKEVGELGVVKEIGNLIRVEDCSTPGEAPL